LLRELCGDSRATNPDSHVRLHVPLLTSLCFGATSLSAPNPIDF
jgi:hypothetical protein